MEIMIKNDRKKIIRLLLGEQSIIGAGICILVIIIFFLLNVSGITELIVIDNVSIYYFKLWHLFATVVCAFILVVVFSVPDILNASKQNISHLLKER